MQENQSKATSSLIADPTQEDNLVAIFSGKLDIEILSSGGSNLIDHFQMPGKNPKRVEQKNFAIHFGNSDLSMTPTRSS